MSKPDTTVFISSTYLDNKDRRKLVEEAVLQARMRPVGMERFAASSNPVVQECEQQARECDIYVGIIARRYGWIPKGKDVSITELEYNAARTAGRPCLMFQIDEQIPFTKDDLDAEDRWLKQEKLDNFKSRYAADQLPAVFTNETLGQKVLDSLYQQLSSNTIREEPSKESIAKTVTEIFAYQQSAVAHYRHFVFAGFKSRLRVRISFDELYVPLRAHVDYQRRDDAEFSNAEDAENQLHKTGEALEISLSAALIEAADRNCRGVVVLGDPGSGKTTQLKRILLSCFEKGTHSIGVPSDTLPVFIPLRQIRSETYTLETLLNTGLGELPIGSAVMSAVQKHRPLLLLLDGLDEVRDLDQREALARAIESLPDDVRVIVSCRFAGYNRSARLADQFLELHVRPLSKSQADQFIRQWYRVVECELAEHKAEATSLAASRANSLISSLSGTDFRAAGVVTMLRNPLLLANICLVHRDKGTLPKRRALLYEECIDVLLEHWRDTIVADEGRRILQPLAYWMHSQEGRTTAEAAALIPVIEPVLPAIDWDKDPATFLSAIRDDSGLLTGWSGDRYGFMHLGFQEYLAAREIRRLALEEGDAVLQQLAARYDNSWWQEVTRLLLALRDPSVFTPLMRVLLQTDAFISADNQLELLEEAIETPSLALVECLQNFQSTMDEKDRPSAQVAFQMLQRIAPNEIEPFKVLMESGVHKGTTTAALTTSMSGKGQVKLVALPAGRFTMGSPDDENGRRDDEGPQRVVEMPAFEIGKYPVTNEQFGLFLKDNADASEPRFWSDRKFNQAQQPVVGVNWRDACAFAAWAGCRLPTEAEWEYACRAGTTGARYHHQLDDIAWFNENTGDASKPVGLKAPNAFGLHDMLGNVWEWVEDHWVEHYEGAPDDGSARLDADGDVRVLRGGSWLNNASWARSAARSRFRRSLSDNDSGFRLARTL